MIFFQQRVQWKSLSIYDFLWEVRREIWSKASEWRFGWLTPVMLQKLFNFFEKLQPTCVGVNALDFVSHLSLLTLNDLYWIQFQANRSKTQTWLLNFEENLQRMSLKLLAFCAFLALCDAVRIRVEVRTLKIDSKSDSTSLMFFEGLRIRSRAKEEEGRGTRSLKDPWNARSRLSDLSRVPRDELRLRKCSSPPRNLRERWDRLSGVLTWSLSLTPSI